MPAPSMSCDLSRHGVHAVLWSTSGKLTSRPLNYTASPPGNPACSSTSSSTSLTVYCAPASGNSTLPLVAFQAQQFGVGGCPAGLGNTSSSRGAQWSLYFPTSNQNLGPVNTCTQLRYVPDGIQSTLYGLVNCAANSNAAAYRYLSVSMLGWMALLCAVLALI